METLDWQDGKDSGTYVAEKNGYQMYLFGNGWWSIKSLDEDFTVYDHESDLDSAMQKVTIVYLDLAGLPRYGK